MQSDWELLEDGQIRQSDNDKKDSNIRIFTETVASHNERIQNVEEPKTDVQ